MPGFIAVLQSMKNTVIISFLFLLVAALGSCTKKQSPNTPFNRLQGKWKLAKTATDDNVNGQIDGAEIFPVDKLLDNEKQFNKDGTGVETNVYNGSTSLPLHFTWRIISNDSVWIAYSANDTLTYYLADISSSSLTLITNTSFGLAWYYYTKK